MLRRFWSLVGSAYRPDRETGGRLTLKRAAVVTAFIPLFLLIQGIHWLGFACDELFFSGYRQIRIRRPLFILGVPRSGTTHLHRVLAEDSRFTTLRTWECLLAPSVTQRKIVLWAAAADRRLGRPLGRLFGRVERRCFQALDAVHPVRLTDPEEDFFVLTPILACFLLVLPFPTAEAVWRLGALDRDATEAEQREVMAFYARCLQRHLYVHGADKVLLSKNASFAPLARALLRRFPDARVVACVRDPVEAVASQLSALREGMALFDVERAAPGFRHRLVDQLVFYYENLHTAVEDLPPRRRRWVPMSELRSDLARTVWEIYRELGISMDAAYAERLSALSEGARTYRSGHRYKLEEFGWAEDEIAAHFANVYRQMTFPTQPGERAAAS